ncbi:unnamed protein product [Linum tenue]|uniref:Uncharacterized protein n=1 Tax=Linum tenue TaxID=586396 RepID=A0AAV0QV76_9ROSI|nr:unnamed protein product [Linum tenue]
MLTEMYCYNPEAGAVWAGVGWGLIGIGRVFGGSVGMELGRWAVLVCWIGCGPRARWSLGPSRWLEPAQLLDWIDLRRPVYFPWQLCQGLCKRSTYPWVGDSEMVGHRGTGRVY